MRLRSFSIFAGLAALAGSLQAAGCSNLVDAAGYHVDPAAYCQRNSDCTNARGPSWMCRASTHSCVNLLSEDCKKFLGDTANDDAVVVGSLFPIEGTDQTSGAPIEDGVELAWDDFKTAGGIPPLAPKRVPRPVVLVVCNDGADAATATRAARHLTDDVGVPAIIGAAYSGITTEVATKVTIPAKVLLISPSSTSVTLTTLPDDGLVWRTCPSDVIQADAHAALMKILEPDLKSRLGADTKLKVAILHKGDPYGRGLGGGLASVLAINDTKANDSANLNYFRRTEYGGIDPSGPDYEARIKELIAFAPHVVYVLGTTETVRKIIPDIEEKWVASAYRPFYLLADGSAVPQMADALRRAPGVRQRMLGTKPGTVGDNFKRFVGDYTSRIHDGTSPEATWAVNAYDAFYMLTYSIVALGNKPLTGPNIIEGFGRQIPAPDRLLQTVQAGPLGINRAFELLTMGQSFDYDGASGPLNFNLQTGEAPSDILLWCVKKDDKGSITDPLTIPDTYFSATTAGITGGGLPAIRAFCDFL